MYHIGCVKLLKYVYVCLFVDSNVFVWQLSNDDIPYIGHRQSLITYEIFDNYIFLKLFKYILLIYKSF